MNVQVGPVTPTSAEAWIAWVREMVGELRRDSASTRTLPGDVLDDVGAYVDLWDDATRSGDVFRWQVDLHPDELEYLTHALYKLDVRLAAEAFRCPEKAAPPEARAFHAILVQALLFTLAQEGPARAAFVEQLRPCWPVAVESR